MKILEKIVGKEVGNYLKGMAYAVGIGLAVLCSSCTDVYNETSKISRAIIKPIGRLGCPPIPMIGTNFPNPENLGTHNLSEKNGQVYTCEAGFIDIAHVRKAADWTKYLREKTYEHLMNNNAEFSFAFKEPSKYFVKLTYPENWGDLKLENKEQIAKDISVGLGQYFSYIGVTWHEMLTWFGYKSYGFFSEFHSAFSYEDIFSDILGVGIAGKVLRNAEYEFNKDITLALDIELKELGAQASQVAEHAAKRLKGKWYSGGGYPFIDMKKRNLDIGLDDGSVTPWLVPGIHECEGAKAKSYPIPKLDILSKYGFSIKLEIEPHEWEKDKILKIIGEKKRIEPVKDFPIIMDYIKKDAVRMYGPDVDKPY